MSTMISFLFIGIIFAIIDLVPLYKEQQWIYFCLYAFLLIAIIILAVLLDLHIKIPISAEPLERIIKYIFGL